MIRYTIKLSQEEVNMLMAIINKGSHTTQKYRAAYILLNCDEGDHSERVTNEQISKVLKVGMRTIDRVKKKFVEEGFGAVLERRPSTAPKPSSTNFFFTRSMVRMPTFRTLLICSLVTLSE